jgi:hemerythrin-like domain-containing protein
MKCTELLAQDHAILRRGLDILDGMVGKLEEGQRIETADIAAFLKFLRIFGDGYHQMMEETVLFPALRRVLPQENPLRQVGLEHRDGLVFVAAMEEALRFKRGRDLAGNARRLTSLLRNHLADEDVAIPDMVRLLSEEEDSAIVAEFTKNRTPHETLVNFARLEWKYLRKPTGKPISSEQEMTRMQGASSYT